MTTKAQMLHVSRRMPHVLEYAQKMLSWRLHYADRTLTGYSASPEGRLDRRCGTAALVAG